MSSSLTAKIPSRLPQENPGGSKVPVNVIGGFYQFLPPKSLSFFKRTYAARAPRPIITSASFGPNFPRIIPIARIEVPKQQVFVVQDVVFTAYRNSNIDPGDYAPLTPLENRRLLSFVGYSFTIGGRSFFDANSNIGNLSGGSGAPSAAPFNFPSATPNNVVSASSALIPYQGSLSEGTRGFSAYGRPQQVIEAGAVYLRPPPFEVERFSVDFSGYLLNETHFDSILGTIAR